MYTSFSPLRLFDFLSHRTVLERGEHELVVAPDQLVAPAPGLPTGSCVVVEKASYLRVHFSPWFVDLLNRLERKARLW